MDINGDGKKNKALLVDASDGRNLVVLTRSGCGYEAYVVAARIGNMGLYCRHGHAVVQAEALGEKKEEHATPGAFVEQKQPEGASVAYSWNGSGFTEVWISDGFQSGRPRLDMTTSPEE